MKAKFENSVSILVQAFFRGTLEPESCKTCAVAHLISRDRKYEFYQYGKNWYSALMSDKPDFNHPDIVITGYSPEELLKIEGAFMFRNGEWRIYGDTDVFSRLMCVVDCLADIHGISLDVKEESKKLFVKV